MEKAKEKKEVKFNRAKIARQAGSNGQVLQINEGKI
jgi:hypothetical protein